VKKSRAIWLQKGDYVTREGDVSPDLYVLLSGTLVVEIDGRKIGTIDLAGDVIGELGALSHKPRTASVFAQTPSEVLVIKNANIVELKKLPSVLEKIDATITRRYQIARNKTRMYTSITASMKRSILQDVMRQRSPRSKDLGGTYDDAESGAARQHIRKRIDEISSLYSEADDPIVLERIASDYGVADLYHDRMRTRPWLDDALPKRLGAIENEWELLTGKGTSAVIVKAEIAVEMNGLLNSFEKMPGIRREMDVMRMEAIVPSLSKVEALRSAFHRRFPAGTSERDRMFNERRIKLAVEGAKADAGEDVTLIINAAKELRIEEEYENNLRNIVGLTETPTSFIDLG